MISVIILTKNEENMLTTCLESVKWADEIIIADNGSSDQTLRIARRFTDKVYIFLQEDFATRRNLAFEKASGDWVLFVDADERVLKELKEEIKELTLTDSPISAYAISRRNIIFGEEKKYDPFWPDWVIRLIRKDHFKGYVGKVHESPKFTGLLGYCKHSFLHLTHRNLDQVILKSLNWSKIDAKLRLDSRHPQMTGWRFLRILFYELINQGIKRKGFFNGTVGVIDSLLQTFSLVMTYIRLWEMQLKQPLNQTYQDIDQKLTENNFNR